MTTRRQPAVTAVAAVDCGTLSTRLLVAGPHGETIERLMRITGLGEGVDSSRRLRPAAVERTLAVLADYRQVMDRHGVKAARMVGTSALRDATDRDLFINAAHETVGVPLELLSGQEEASLSLLGASSDLSPASAPWLIVDIGGGSTELAVGPVTGDGPPAVSMDLGCVRVTERFLHHDPPMSDELARARAWLAGELAVAEAAMPGLRGARTLVGLAGTVSALSCWHQGLHSYERQRVHHSVLERSVVRAAVAELAALPAAARAGLPGIDAGRAGLIVAGALVLEAVMDHFGFGRCLVSEADILDGLVLSLLGRS